MTNAVHRRTPALLAAILALLCTACGPDRDTQLSERIDAAQAAADRAEKAASKAEVAAQSARSQPSDESFADPEDELVIEEDVEPDMGDFSE